MKPDFEKPAAEFGFGELAAYEKLLSELLLAGVALVWPVSCGRFGTTMQPRGFGAVGGG